MCITKFDEVLLIYKDKLTGIKKFNLPPIPTQHKGSKSKKVYCFSYTKFSKKQKGATPN